MRSFVSLIVTCLMCAQVLSSSERRYFPEEEKRNDKQSFAVIPDDDGIPHLVNLRTPKIDYEVTPEDVTIYFFSRANPTDGLKFETANFDGTINSDQFDPTRKTVFVTHGWTGKNTSRSCRDVRDGLLVEDAANVFVIDWSGPSHQFYTVLVGKVLNKLGGIVAGFIDTMLAKYDMDASNVMLVAHSLGTHIVGAAGSAMAKKPGVIIGLDPAKPLFYVDEPENRLSIDDAEYLTVIHTNGGFLSFRSSIGHADYFPNGGGMVQPGCGTDLVGICAHSRSHDFYAESLWTSGFKSYKCDSYENYKNGLCQDNQVSYFGGLNIDTTTTGDFYLDTNAESPFAQN